MYFFFFVYKISDLLFVSIMFVSVIFHTKQIVQVRLLLLILTSFYFFFKKTNNRKTAHVFSNAHNELHSTVSFGECCARCRR